MFKCSGDSSSVNRNISTVVLLVVESHHNRASEVRSKGQYFKVRVAHSLWGAEAAVGVLHLLLLAAGVLYRWSRSSGRVCMVLVSYILYYIFYK